MLILSSGLILGELASPDRLQLAGFSLNSNNIGVLYSPNFLSQVVDSALRVILQLPPGVSAVLERIDSGRINRSLPDLIWEFLVTALAGI